MSNIIELRETSPNHWQAKYQGNYGVYTIKISTDGKRRSAFSCSCLSEENIQIESFRQRLVEKKIKAKDFAGAKKLVHDYINQHKGHDSYYSSSWDAFLLQIAQS